ncbi:Protein ADM2 [Galemys pyrenaicus]|uniref:Protein ADM2 n=1 Tax=Galemys pyrenaicus TaxID=202257 RepID=A0A8J6AEL7_GALPY|nr:Protein ADM2 [Galemys pyrenaicus]
MARLCVLCLACISLYLQLPGILSRGPGGSARPAGVREPPARTPPRGPQHQHPTPRPVVWKLQQALRPQKRVHQALSTGRLPRASPRRHHHGQLMRVGCRLSTCRVQHLSHRLWQLAGPAGLRDSAPVDPSSPHSYG